MQLDGNSLIRDINEEIESLGMEIEGATKNCWYEKAAKLHLQREGVKRVKHMIELGDYTI